MMVTSLLLAGVISMVTGADLQGTFQLMQHWDDNFEAKFCFNLAKPIVGWEIDMHFTIGVKQIQWDGDFIHGTSGTDCSNHYEMLNKGSKGNQKAGEFCIRMMGKLCGKGNPGGQATLKDLSDDHMKLPQVHHAAGAQHTKYDYAEVLMKSILFYEAQRSGKLPANNRITWRADSALNDKGSGGEDLTGGWYDAGDNVKFNLPMAWSTTVLTWSLLQWKDAYEKTQLLNDMLDGIRWPLEYLLKCHTKANELYVQVGDGGTDHGSWTSPERMTGTRPAFKIDASKPGSDVAGETAAAMAAGYLAFKDKDPAFAQKLLTHAKQLYDFADKHRGKYSDSVNAAAAYYKSAEIEDELGWGAIWLYKATKDQAYLTKAESHHEAGAAWGFSWDEKTGGVNKLREGGSMDINGTEGHWDYSKCWLYEATKNDKYKQDIVATMTSWMPGGDLPYTPKCLAFRLQWGALRYSANTALLALVAADLGINADQYRKWATSQINYALGDGGRSYVVGFGTNPPQRPHHRASSCPMLPAPCGWEAQQSPGPNPHVLYGALVGGPGKSDDYTDDRKDYVKNEVACDYNAGFHASVAGVMHLAIHNQLPASYQDICSHHG